MGPRTRRFAQGRPRHPGHGSQSHFDLLVAPTLLATTSRRVRQRRLAGIARLLSLRPKAGAVLIRKLGKVD
jgi:hypothetical protein